MNDPLVKKICTGYSHSLLLRKNGELFVCGSNNYGELGIGKDKKEETKFILLTTEVENIFCGANHSFIYKKNKELLSFGNNYNGQLGIGNKENQYEPFLLFKEIEIKTISCGIYHSIILKMK